MNIFFKNGIYEPQMSAVLKTPFIKASTWNYKIHNISHLSLSIKSNYEIGSKCPEYIEFPSLHKY